MLVLSRKITESIRIGDDIVVKVIGIQGHRVKIGISAPGQTPIFRTELLELDAVRESNSRDLQSAIGTGGATDSEPPHVRCRQVVT